MSVYILEIGDILDLGTNLYVYHKMANTGKLYWLSDITLVCNTGRSRSLSSR